METYVAHTLHCIRSMFVLSPRLSSRQPLANPTDNWTSDRVSCRDRFADAVADLTNEDVAQTTVHC